MKNWCFVKNGNSTGSGYPPTDLAEMIFTKKICGHRDVISKRGHLNPNYFIRLFDARFFRDKTPLEMIISRVIQFL